MEFGEYSVYSHHWVRPILELFVDLSEVNHNSVGDFVCGWILFLWNLYDGMAKFKVRDDMMPAFSKSINSFLSQTWCFEG